MPGDDRQLARAAEKWSHLTDVMLIVQQVRHAEAA